MNSITLAPAEVRALANTGRVTVRRKIEPQPGGRDKASCELACEWFIAENGRAYARLGDGNFVSTQLACPHGRPGDVLAAWERTPGMLGYLSGPTAHRPTLATVAVVRGDGEDRAWEWEMGLEVRS